ncbi:hypothetical protein KC867_03020, partial [Candidatus Saccharibacteria bacterium]|nr:hypothetical protein [Candidatus Saccharibacteria bacterium]
SWMQRILDRETSDEMMKYNLQGETNLHNIMTSLFEKLYYSGGFILLTLLPLYRKQFADLLKSTSLKKVIPLLPSAWLVVPMLAINGFSGYHKFLFTVLFIFALCIGLGLISKNAKNISVSLGVVVSLVASVTIFVVVSFLNFEATSTRGWFYTEYREMFIALGIMIYSLDQLWSIYRTKDPVETNT